MHRHHQHQEEVNEERVILLQKKRRLWSKAEDEKLMDLANEEWTEGMLKKDHLALLQAFFSHRTTDGLKKRLQHLGWRPSQVPLQEQVLPTAVSPQLPAPSRPTRTIPFATATPMLPSMRRAMKWTSEEDAKLQAQASEIWRPDLLKGDLAKALAAITKGRTAGAIRKRLQLLKWISPELGPPRSPQNNTEAGEVETEVTANDGGTSPTTGALENRDSGELTTGLSPDEGWRAKLLDTALATLEDPRVGAQKLKGIAEGLLGGWVSLEQAAQSLESAIQECIPLKWNPVKRRRVFGKKPRSNREIRRARYAHTQRLYKLKRKDAAHSILEGRWREAYRGMDCAVEGVEEYWAKVFETSTTETEPSEASPQSSGQIKWELVSPITTEEIRLALDTMRKTSVGMDKLSPQELLTWHLPSLAGLMNTILAVERLPSHLAMARVTFRPKVDSPVEPGDYRPIAISSVLARTLHKILARRMRDHFKFSPLQYAFLQRDGCLEASALLHAVLRRSHEEVKPMAAAFLDISKVFDSVSHNAILAAGRKAGTPPPLLSYLSHLYENATLHLGTSYTKCKKGVRQGDPISPILFILAMGEVLEEALPEVGIGWGTEQLGSIAYADDLILLADTPGDLQMKLDGLCKVLSKAGMALNIKKSATLTILKDGRRKHLLLAPSTYESKDGTIQAMGVADSQRYLGVYFTWKGRTTPKQTKEVERMLMEITSAPLKPYQRLEVVRDFLVPKLQHELVLGCAHRNTIGRIDKMIRGSIRAWLRLPKDTSLGFLHAPVKSGGLGMPSLGTTLPLLQKRRFEKLLSCQTSTERTLVMLPSFQSTLRRVNLPCRVGKETVFSPQDGNEEWTRVLVSSADGRSLVTDDIDPASYHWIRKPHSVFPRLHLRGIQLPGGTLFTKARASRGRERSSEEVACRGGCQARETLEHILQSCEVTHNARCAWHNRIVKLVEKGLRRKVERTWIEPIIPTIRSFIKPDIVVETEHHITVLDVSVVANPRMK